MVVGRDELEASLAGLRATVVDPRAGIHGPGSTAWRLERDGLIFLGGGRAVLLQLAHPFVAHAIAGLGDADAHRGVHSEALVSYDQALERMEHAYGPDHLYLLHPLTGLGEVYARLGQTDQAEAHFSRAVAIAERLTASHPLYARSLEGLAGLAAASGSLARASTLYAKAARVYRESAGTDSPEGARAAQRAEDLAAGATP